MPGGPPAAFAPTPRPPPAPRVELSTRDLASVYAAALLAAERLALGREPAGVLLLQELTPHDTALEGELLRRHAVAGICEVTSQIADVCTNDVRGFTASIVAFLRPAAGDDVAFVAVQVRPMRAERDRTWLVPTRWQHWFLEVIKRDSIWMAAPWQP